MVHESVGRAVRGALRLGAGPYALAGLTALAANAVYAQQPGPQTQQGEVEEVVVTGSRIARSTFTTPAPVTTIDRTQMEAVGATNVGEFLMRIPQTISEVNSSNEVFSVNASALQVTALRNLGSERTLVLLNGQRFVSGLNPSAGYAVDLNAIPVHMIERIEILTGGTSAVYGSDAIAGVVNVITRTDFEGVEISGQAYAPSDGDRERADLSLTIGSNFERGNAWASFGFSDDQGMKARDRDFSALDIAYFPEDVLGQEGWFYLGSSFPPQARIGDYNGDGTPFVFNLGDPEGGDLYNRASARDLASPVRRRLAMAGARYDIAEGISTSLTLNWSNIDIRTEFE